MIPKRIIYCWFGNNSKKNIDLYCMDSWKKICPDYEILEISEKNFDITINEFCKQSYDNKNYAFVSDVARLWALQKYGGFYLDTDIRLIKSLDILRDYNAIISSQGKAFFNNSPLGCDKFPEVFNDVFKDLTFGYSGYSLLNNYCHNKYCVFGEGIENFKDITFLGPEFFITPKNPEITKNTIGIHYCNESWLENGVWQGGFNTKNTFNAFEIYQEGIRDKSKEDKYFSSIIKIGKIETKNKPFCRDMIYYGNYFFNQSVMKLKGPGFTISRFNPKPINKIIKVENGNIELECY